MKKLGRPKLPEDTVKKVAFSLRLSNQQIRDLKLIAKVKGYKTLASYLRYKLGLSK